MENFEMTYEQIQFYKKKKVLERLDAIKSEREWTYEEKQKRDDILLLLWKMVKKFAISEMRKMTQTYVLDNDGYADIEQSLSMVFYEKLPAYDPRISTPTTYFVRYFKQEINGYLLKNSLHLSQYDANNVKIVRRAINYYEAKGIKWTDEMIVNRTNLSAKVVKAALQHQKVMRYKNVDDDISISSKQPTPEQAYIENEQQEALMSLVTEDLTDRERMILEERVNFEGDKYTPYTQVARNLGITEKEVKTVLNNIIPNKARANQKLANMYPTKNKIRKGYKTTDPAAKRIESELSKVYSA